MYTNKVEGPKRAPVDLDALDEDKMAHTSISLFFRIVMFSNDGTQ